MKRAAAGYLPGPEPKFPRIEESIKFNDLSVDALNAIFSTLEPAGIETISLLNKKFRHLIINSDYVETKSNVDCYKKLIGPRQVANCYLERNGEKPLLSDEEVVSKLSLLPNNIFAQLKAPSDLFPDEAQPAINMGYLIYVPSHLPINQTEKKILDLVEIGKKAFLKLDLELDIELGDELGVNYESDDEDRPVSFAKYHGYQYLFYPEFFENMEGHPEHSTFEKEEHKWMYLPKQILPGSVHAPDNDFTLQDFINRIDAENGNGKINALLDNNYDIPLAKDLLFGMFTSAMVFNKTLFHDHLVAAKTGENRENEQAIPLIGRFNQAYDREPKKIGICIENSAQFGLDTGIAPVIYYK